MKRILIVDDDMHIRELLRFYLQRDGYQTVEAADGREALAVLEQQDVHLAIVDIMMPHVDGYELCKEIRELHDLPVLMLTAKGELADKEKAFIAGTDDYLVKPFEPKEVLFRVRALLRRYQMAFEDKIRVGNVTINRKSYQIETDSSTFEMPLKEFELLAQLAEFPNRIFTREQLIDLVWGSQFEGNDRTVDVHIKRLRERFPAESSGFSIETVRGMGYKLVV
ncbi:response regulator transcription factor [Aciduricibacillus chroicocephali]|uniref:Heme response regulator HssR n=1 Tax=Aciduricibacillus chroicocephali TaxID=3054939 RepID=A0ABY9KVU4_9BACI|nr:response regulator transcription factor [Bacillaceae bacterium 44XB]